MKLLSINELIELITNNELTLKQSLGLITTPKSYGIVFKDYLYTTDDINRTLARIVNDHPQVRVNDISIVNCKEYQRYLITT